MPSKQGLNVKTRKRKLNGCKIEGYTHIGSHKIHTLLFYKNLFLLEHGAQEAVNRQKFKNMLIKNMMRLRKGEEHLFMMTTYCK